MNDRSISKESHNNSQQEENPQTDEENSISCGGKECTMCHYVPESIIFLSCEHIVCLVCAAKLILSENEEKDLDFSEVKCGICGETTDLSKEVQETLLEFLNNGNFEFESDEEVDKQSEKELEEEEDENDGETIKEEEQSESNRGVDEDEEEEEDREENESNRDEEEEEENAEEETERSELNSDFSVSFACQNHVGEEYTFYNTKSKTLYCNQCLLNEKMNQACMDSVKPLKKCFPEILQNFQEMLNKVEVCKNLLDNKHKSFEIRKNNAKTQSLSFIKKFEIETDELIDQLQETKQSLMKKLETNNEALISQLDDQESNYEAKIDYFNAIMEQINNFKQNSNNPEEEIFSFFFANQEKIYEALDEENKDTVDKAEKTVFREFEEKIKFEYNSLLKMNYQTAISKTESYLSKLNQKMPVMVTQPNRTNQRNSIRNSHRTNQENTQNTSRVYNNLVNENGKDKPDFSKFLQKIRQQSISFKERPISTENEKQRENNSYNKSVLNWWKRENTNSRNTSNYFNKTMEKGRYNAQKKLELEKKLKMFEFRSKKDEFFQSTNTTVNFRKNKDSLSNKLEHLRNQLKMRSMKPNLNQSIKDKSIL